MAEETKTKNSPFMDRFIEAVYPKLSSGLIKNEEEGGKFLAETYKNILEGKANIKNSNIKLVSVNYDEAESLIVRGLSQNMLPIPTTSVQESDENNPPGLKTMVDGFIKFWENSKWTEAPLGLACSPELVEVDGKKFPAIKVTQKENGKDELIAGMKKILEITRPVTKTDSAVETDVKETLGMFAKELEQQFNKIAGEYIGLDCNDSSKKITVNWDGIVFESLQITLVGLEDPKKAMTFVLAFVLFILFMASSGLESTATSFGILLLVILLGSDMEEIQFSLTGGIGKDGKVNITGQLAGGAGGTGGTGGTGGVADSPKLDSIITQLNLLTATIAALAARGGVSTTGTGGTGGTGTGAAGGGTNQGGGTGGTATPGGTPTGTGGTGTGTAGTGTAGTGTAGTGTGGTNQGSGTNTGGGTGGGTPTGGGTGDSRSGYTISQWIGALGLDSSKVSVSGNTVTYEGDVDLRGKGLTNIPIKFSYVSGKFNCSGLGLTSLQNSPTSCSEFDCSNNNLTSLVGGPETVFKKFICSGNQLKDLVGGPKGGENSGNQNLITLYDCSNNKLESLNGYPTNPNIYIVTFNCSNNKTLKTLKFISGGIGTLDCSDCAIPNSDITNTAFTAQIIVASGQYTPTSEAWDIERWLNRIGSIDIVNTSRGI